MKRGGVAGSNSSTTKPGDKATGPPPPPFDRLVRGGVAERWPLGPVFLVGLPLRPGALGGAMDGTTLYFFRKSKMFSVTENGFNPKIFGALGTRDP